MILRSIVLAADIRTTLELWMAATDPTADRLLVEVAGKHDVTLRTAGERCGWVVAARVLDQSHAVELTPGNVRLLLAFLAGVPPLAEIRIGASSVVLPVGDRALFTVRHGMESVRVLCD
jgi:hypothetical protein